MNLAAADVNGVEVELAWRLTPTIDVSANVAHVETDVVDAGVDTGTGATFVEGERLLRRPAWTGSVRAAWRLPGGASLGASASYQGERADRDFNVFPAAPVVLDAYALVGVHLRVPMPTTLLGRFASLHIRADNLLDTAYQNVFGFRSPGRQVVGGIRIESP